MSDSHEVTEGVEGSYLKKKAEKILKRIDVAHGNVCLDMETRVDFPNCPHIKIIEQALKEEGDRRAEEAILDVTGNLRSRQPQAG